MEESGDDINPSLRKTTKTPATMAGLRAEIWTSHFPNSDHNS